MEEIVDRLELRVPATIGKAEERMRGEVSRAGSGAGQGKDILKAEPGMAPPLGLKAPCPASLSQSCEGKPGTLVPR